MTEARDVEVEVLGRKLKVHTSAAPEDLDRAVAVLEDMFSDMGRAYELRWGNPPSALDTSSWLLMGALNMAHRVACLEREAVQHTQNLEQTLTKLLDDVPDEVPSSSGPKLQGMQSRPSQGPDI